MKKYVCSLVLGSLLCGVVYADDSLNGLSFGVGLDYGFDSVYRKITPLPLQPGQADIISSTFENKIGVIGSLQYLTQLGVLFDTQLRLSYLIPDFPSEIKDTFSGNISSAGFNAELACLGDIGLDLGKWD